MELKDKIQILRKARGLSQQELGDRLSKATYGISRQAISDWENGKSIPKLDNLRDLAKVLNISFDVLLDENCDLNDSQVLAEVISGNYKKNEVNSTPYLNMDIYIHKRVPKILALILIFLCISSAFIIGVYLFKDVDLSIQTNGATIMSKLDSLLASLAVTNETLRKVYIYGIVIAGLMPFIFLAGVLYAKVPDKKMIGHFDSHALTINKDHLAYYPRSKIADIFLGKKKGLDKSLIILTKDGKQVAIDHIIDPNGIVNAFQDLKSY